MKKLTATLLICICSINSWAEPIEVKPPKTKMLSSASGRFVFGQISDYRSDQYLLDTETGRLWQIVKTEDDQIVLQPVPIKQIVGGTAYLPDTDEEAKSHQLFMHEYILRELNDSQKKSEQKSPEK